jgi:hypothetical protein
LCISRKSGGDLCEIDGSHLDDSDDQIDNAIDTSSVPVKMGSMRLPVEATTYSGVALGAKLWKAEKVFPLPDG